MSNPGADKGYALDFTSVIRHVATEMEEARVGARAISIDAMAASYRHVVTGDLARVRRHHALASDAEAVRFLVECAVASLDGRVERTDDGYRLARPLASLRYPPDAGHPRHRIEPSRDLASRFGAPFDPMSGRFSDNTRSLHRDTTLDELRESMRAAGWLPHHPAIKDERGVVIVGHRRLTVAAELGIEPDVVVVRFGAGDDADAARLRMAVYSNLGAKPLTPSDRQALAEYLYRDKLWTMAAIAEALAVSTSTIGNDLSNVGKSRPGRPRKERPPALSPDNPPPVPPAIEGALIARVDQGEPVTVAARAVGISREKAEDAVQRERGRREVLAQRSVCPECGHVTPHDEA